MSTQYLRKMSLVLYDDAGDTLDLSNLKITFKVGQADLQTPATMTARVYNLADSTALRVVNEFNRVTLRAGYQEGNFGTLFDGELKYFHRGRENATDTYLDLFASNRDEAYTFATIHATMGAGSTPTERLAMFLKVLASYGITEGFQCSLPSNKLPRARVFYGATRDFIRQLCLDNGVSATIQPDGSMQVINDSSYAPGEIVVLTAKTGMIGRPEQSPEGIKVKTLLNSAIQVARRVQIDNASINQTVYPGGSGVNGQFLAYDQWSGYNYLAGTANDKIYRVAAVEHSGDTRGNDWYTSLICIVPGDDGYITPTLLARGLGADR